MPHYRTVTAGAAPCGVAAPRFLADSLARVRELQKRADVRFGLPRVGARWVTCAGLLAEPAGFDRWRAGLARWLVAQYGEAPDRTTAGYVLTWYLWVPAYLGALLFHHERRVPSLRPEDLAFRMGEPRPHPDVMAVLATRFVCLPDDPAAGTAQATVVPDERALAAVLRGRFVAHATRFVTAFGPTVRFGRHTMWAAATDALDNALWLAGRYGGDEAAGALDAALVLPARLAPLTSASTVRVQPDDRGWTRRRESCCFHYLLREGMGECDTCPRVLPKG
jgi:FhuF-like iron-sulfur protein